MRSVAITEFGGPEVLQVVELPDPTPSEGQVRIRVTAAAVNPTDMGMRSGNSAAGLEAFDKPYVPGMELSGVIDQVGPGAPWAVGDRVMAIVMPSQTGRGAQSELVIVPGESVARVPEGTSLEAAATLPMNGLTVRRALDLLGLQPGQWLAVTGAAGAVGGYAVELGVVEGLRVVGVASPGDEALIRGFGAEAFIERGERAVEAIRSVVPDGVDALLDAAVIGLPIFGAITDGGKYATVRGYSGETERSITVVPVHVSEYAKNHEALAALGDLVAAGHVTLRVAETFPPGQASEAHRKLAAGGVRGRLVIVF